MLGTIQQGIEMESGMGATVEVGRASEGVTFEQRLG